MMGSYGKYWANSEHSAILLMTINNTGKAFTHTLITLQAVQNLARGKRKSHGNKGPMPDTVKKPKYVNKLFSPIAPAKKSIQKNLTIVFSFIAKLPLWRQIRM